MSQFRTMLTRLMTLVDEHKDELPTENDYLDICSWLKHNFDLDNDVRDDVSDTSTEDYIDEHTQDVTQSPFTRHNIFDDPNMMRADTATYINVRLATFLDCDEWFDHLNDTFKEIFYGIINIQINEAGCPNENAMQLLRRIYNTQTQYSDYIVSQIDDMFISFSRFAHYAKLANIDMFFSLDDVQSKVIDDNINSVYDILCENLSNNASLWSRQIYANVRYDPDNERFFVDDGVPEFI